MTDSIKLASFTACKGFKPDWTCRDFQYEVGRTYHQDESISVCARGFHASEYPLDVWLHYGPVNNRFAIVRQSGACDICADQTKTASATISIEREIGVVDLALEALKFLKTQKPDSVHVSDYANDGHHAAISDEENSAAESTGPDSTAMTVRDFSVASANGIASTALARDSFSAALTTGFKSTAIASGKYCLAAAGIERMRTDKPSFKNVASVTGYESMAIAMGDDSVALALDDSSMACTSDRFSAALTNGSDSMASVQGPGSIALGIGPCNKAKALSGCAMVLVYRNYTNQIVHIRASKVGENGIKPDVWYELNEQGQFIEARDQSSMGWNP